MALSSCEKAKDVVQPSETELKASQAQEARKDDDYKRNKTGQYVSKDVQVTGYEDGSERPIRPKFDAAEAISTLTLPPDEPCEGCNGGYIPPAPQSSTFVSSEGRGAYGNIYNLEFIKDSDPLPSAETGYTRLDVDLNRGAGGKYIYISFTRDPEAISQFHKDYQSRSNPLTHLYAKGYTTGLSEWVAAPEGYGYIYEYTGNWATPSSLFDYKVIDLNDGSGGKYIYAYSSRYSSKGSPIREVGILYGNNSSIVPPTGWIKDPQDLNEGAGGDYIYLCYKR